MFTPDAQCLGDDVFRYAVAPFGGDYLEANIKQLSQAFRVHVLTIQGVVDSSISGGQGLVEHSSEFTCVSAIKKHEQRNSLLLRIYNVRGEPSSDSLTFGLTVAAAWRTNLLEERVEELTPASSRTLELILGPHEVVTLEVVFAAE
jgi:alpha-mannosidase